MRYPRGKISKDDEGELSIAMTVRKGTLIISFGGKPVSWIGLGKKEATELANLLLKRAEEIT